MGDKMVTESSTSPCKRKLVKCTCSDRTDTDNSSVCSDKMVTDNSTSPCKRKPIMEPEFKHQCLDNMVMDNNITKR